MSETAALPPPPTYTTALGARGVTKRFGDLVANDDVSVEIAPGKVLALLGENGAGKSTLVNILFGLYRPDEGEVVIADEVVRLASPSDAISRGVGMVHQHFQLVPPMNVVRNIVLGAEPHRAGMMQLGTAREEVLALQEKFGLEVDPDANVEELPVGAQQRVEILKALYRDARVLILDEPTAVLTPQETEHLLSVLAGLVKNGMSVVFITHKLREALSVADDIMVMRGGRVVGRTTPAETSEAALAEMMVGRSVLLRVQSGEANPTDEVLRITNLSVDNDLRHEAVKDVSLSVRAGEIVGIAGVEGNGQRELVEAVTGLRRINSGEVQLGNATLTGATPRRIANAGVGHVPEDRQKHGLIGSYSVAENSVLNCYHRAPFSWAGVMRHDQISEHAGQVVGEFDVRTVSLGALTDQLSGGNQQKLVVGREFSREASRKGGGEPGRKSGDKSGRKSDESVNLLVIAQPTRGVDIGAIEFIHSQIIEQRDAGAAVLLVSAELDEVMGLSDRIIVLYEGRAVADLDGKTANREEIGLLMAGASAAEPSPAGASAE